jgi:hypothetical protein
MLWQQSALAAIALIDVCVERFGQAGARRLIGAKVLPAWCERLSDAMARIDGTSAGREWPHCLLQHIATLAVRWRIGHRALL